MGDSAEFQKLSAIEARLAAALDKIAGSVGTGGADGARIAALEARLAETQAALSEAEGKIASGEADETLRQKLEAVTAARRADADEMRRALIGRDDEIRKVRGELAEVKAAAAAAPTVDPAATAQMEKEMAVLRRRAKRLLAERDAARAESDAARDLLDEVAKEAMPDARVLDLRREVRVLSERVTALGAEMDTIRAASSVDPAMLDKALIAQLAALEAARAADAAELDRIIADLASRPAGTTEGEARHA